MESFSRGTLYISSFHLDGMLLGTGTAGAAIRIWDVTSQSNISKMYVHIGITITLFFKNVYFLVTLALDGVGLWDIRKLKDFSSLALYDIDISTHFVKFN